MNEDLNDLAKATAEGLAKGIAESEAGKQLVVPAAKEFGAALGVIGAAVNVALDPLRLTVWGYSSMRDWIVTEVTKRLNKKQVEYIASPDISIIGPAVENLKFRSAEEEIKEMYANLIASSMDPKTSSSVHPGFSEIIRNMSSQEARLFKYLAEIKMFPFVDIYIKRPNGLKVHFAGQINIMPQEVGLSSDYNYLFDNLMRLGLIEAPPNQYIIAENSYNELLQEANAYIRGQEGKPDIKKRFFRLTQLGVRFSRCCLD